MTNQITLFDVDNEPIQIIFKSKYQKWKYLNKYCKAEKYSDIKCKNCRHRFITHSSGKIYYKCFLLGMSGSTATDIRLSNVCKNFVSKEEY